MKFEIFISRINEEIIQKIVGKPSLQILNILDTDLTRISQLQSVLLNIYSPIELLRNKEIRNDFFDILREQEAKDLLDSLGKAPAGDSYSTLKTINFNNELEFSNLLDFFEIEREVITDEVVQNSLTFAVPSYPLFTHQRKAVGEIYNKLYFDNKRVLLHMPTGSGKTRTAMNIISNHFRNNEPTIVLWLAHTEELCEQAASEFENAWRHLGNREINLIRYWGSASIAIDSLQDAFIIGGLAKMYNLLKSNASAFSRLGSKLTLVIMDEAHMAIAATYKSTLEVLLSFQASLLGLSATPGRTWNDPNADIQLSNFFNRKKVTLKVDGFDNPVDYLIENGYLAKVKNSPLLYESGITISERDMQYLKDNLQLPDKFLKQLSEDQKRNIRIIQKVEELVKKHDRIILFGLNVAHSNLLATCLQARNVRAFSITSKTDPAQRRRLIDLFKGDEQGPIVLCNYGILTTGFDAPKTSCAVISRPTDSLVLYSQMVGRAIRGVNAGGNSEAEIVTVVDTCLPGFDAVTNAFFNWEDVWN
jgi:superfamily II DNA or RNA helicase